MTDKQSKELKKLTSPKRIVDELKSHLNLCSGCDIIDKVKELEEISNTINSENDRLEEENEKYIKRYCEEECEIAKLKEEIKDLKKQYHKEFVKSEYKTMVKEDDKEEKIYNLELENKQLKEENKKLIDELECRNSTWETKEKEFEAELKDKDAIIEYLNTQLDKYKKLFGEIKKETDKAKDIKGIMVNEDKTIITINGIELNIGDKFTTDNTEYILKEIYIGKSGKYSLRTDKNTIRLGNKYIIGKEVINKFEN